MTENKRKWLFIFLVLVPGATILTLALPLIIQSLQPLPPIPALPNPNGYDDFLLADTMLDAEQVDYLVKGEAELRRQVSANAEALAIGCKGLTNECRVPVQFNSAYNSNHLSDLTALKNLAFTFMAEGCLAELENYPGHAVKSYLDTMELGIKSA